MRLRIPCPNPACAIMFAVADSLRGKRVRCPRCRTAFTVPAEGGETVASGAMPVVVANLPATIGRYHVRTRLGAGACGTVYRAHDPQLDREVAVKLLKPEALASPQAVERFQREARVNARMFHPNIVPVFDAGRHEEGYYIASAFIDGPSLADVVPEEGLELRRAATLAVQLADALAAAHRQGVMHRDVKPANIMLDAEDHLYLTDFGLAGWMQQEHTQLTHEGAVLGTPAYMAPEQAAGETQQVGPASDQYSAGVVLYQLLTGRPPFQGPPVTVVYHILHGVPPPPGQFRADLDPALAVICMRAMARRPEDRYPGCQEFAAALRVWLTGQPPLLEVPDNPPQAKARRPAPRLEVPLPTQSNAASGQETSMPVLLPVPGPPSPRGTAKRPPAPSVPEVMAVQPIDEPEFVGVKPVRKQPPRPPRNEEEDVPRAPRPLYVLLWTILFLGGGVGLAAGGVAALLFFLQSRKQPEESIGSTDQRTALLKDLSDFANGLEGPADKGDAALSAATLAGKIDLFRERFDDCSKRMPAPAERGSVDSDRLRGQADEVEKLTKRITSAVNDIWGKRKFDSTGRIFTALQRFQEAAGRFEAAARRRKLERRRGKDSPPPPKEKS